MGFSEEWDSFYRQNRHMSLWPWSDMVSLVRRNCRDITPDMQVLELGCGAGANIPFFASLGVCYYAVEGSDSVVAMLKERFPQFADSIVVGDFTVSIPFDNKFEIVVDRGSLTCNSEVDVRRCLDLVFDCLVPGGYFIGVDLYSTNHSDFCNGEPGGDHWTRMNFESGNLQGVGKVHFSDENHVRSLFSKFDILSLDEKQQRTVVPYNNHLFASWMIVARKPFG